jgi:hypothetical protein
MVSDTNGLGRSKRGSPKARGSSARDPLPPTLQLRPQVHPQLDAVDRPTLTVETLGGEFVVEDPRPGRHPLRVAVTILARAARA